MGDVCVWFLSSVHVMLSTETDTVDKEKPASLHHSVTLRYTHTRTHTNSRQNPASHLPDQSAKSLK